VSDIEMRTDVFTITTATNGTKTLTMVCGVNEWQEPETFARATARRHPDDARNDRIGQLLGTFRAFETLQAAVRQELAENGITV
jgi:hypothetical protein